MFMTFACYSFLMRNIHKKKTCFVLLSKIYNTDFLSEQKVYENSSCHQLTIS